MTPEKAEQLARAMVAELPLTGLGVRKDLTAKELAVFVLVDSFGRVASKDLQAMLGLKAATVSKVLAALIARGIVMSDGTRLRFELTSRGKSLRTRRRGDRP